MAASGEHPITMSNASVPVVHEVEIIDELGRRKPTFIPGERSLTIYLDKREVVTLMTLGYRKYPGGLGNRFCGS
jgi:hypothetical protein